VGHTFPDKAFVVDAVRVQEFVRALGAEPEPGYRAEKGATVPPGFLMYVTTYGAEEVNAALGVGFLDTLFASAHYEYRATVRVGDTVTVRPSVTGRTEKDGSSGRLVFWELTCDYLSGDGELLVRERTGIVQKGGA
jgi:hypothetical protein